MVYTPRPDETEDYDYEYGDDLPCTWCGGEGIEENDDPLWYPGDFITCRACGGTGSREDQTLF